MSNLGFTLLALSIYSLLQGTLNVYHSKAKKGYKNGVNWSYQNKEICWKTARINFETFIITLVLSILFLIIGK